MPGKTDPKGAAPRRVLVWLLDFQDKESLGSCTKRSRDLQEKIYQKEKTTSFQILRNHKLLEENMREFLKKFRVEKIFLIMTQNPEAIKEKG